MTLSRLRALLLAVAGVAVLSLLMPATASAHAVLEETTPGDGAVLDVAPAEVTLQFNEIVAVRDDAVTVIGPDGNAVEGVAVSAVNRTVHAVLPDGLGEGSYVVSWRVTSADSHPVAGAFVFHIGAPTAGIVAPNVTMNESGGWQATRAVTQFVAYLGVLVAVGLIVFISFVHDGGSEVSRLRRLALIAAAAGSVGVVASVPIHVVDLVGDGLSGLSDTAARGEVLRGAAGGAALTTLVGLVALIIADRLEARTRFTDAVMGAAAVVALAGFVITGHTRTFGPWWLVVTSDLVHLAAAAIWLGGLIGLTVMLRHRLAAAASGDVSAATTAAAIARFSTLAALSLILVGGLGVVLGWRIVGSWSALFDTGYGTVLLIKVALVAVVAGLGGYNRFRLLGRHHPNAPHTTQARLLRVVRVEALILVAVVAATALLVDRSPADTAAASAPAATDTAPAPQRAEIDLGDAIASVTVEPARAGSNQIAIALHDPDTHEQLEPRDPPTLELTHIARNIGPLRFDTNPAGDGSFATDADLPVAGEWQLRLTVRLDAYRKPIGVAVIEITES